MSIDFGRVFDPDFFARSTLAVAPDLLGSLLCRRLSDGGVLYAPIVEVEAYTADDPACHAARGKTRRCEVMFGPPGYSYVYFIYGMYNCLNVVTEPSGTPGAVLVRAVGIDGGNGPGKLCQTLGIDRRHNALNLMDPDGDIWIVQGTAPGRRQIGRSARVGISLAQDRPWRFFIKDHPQISVLKVRPHEPKKSPGGKA